MAGAGRQDVGSQLDGVKLPLATTVSETQHWGGSTRGISPLSMSARDMAP